MTRASACAPCALCGAHSQEGGETLGRVWAAQVLGRAHRCAHTPGEPPPLILRMRLSFAASPLTPSAACAAACEQQSPCCSPLRWCCWRGESAANWKGCRSAGRRALPACVNGSMIASSRAGQPLGREPWLFSLSRGCEALDVKDGDLHPQSQSKVTAPPPETFLYKNLLFKFSSSGLPPAALTRARPPPVISRVRSKGGSRRSRGVVGSLTPNEAPQGPPRLLRPIRRGVLGSSPGE